MAAATMTIVLTSLPLPTLTRTLSRSLFGRRPLVRIALGCDNPSRKCSSKMQSLRSLLVVKLRAESRDPKVLACRLRDHLQRHRAAVTTEARAGLSPTQTLLLQPHHLAKQHLTGTPQISSFHSNPHIEPVMLNPSIACPEDCGLYAPLSSTSQHLSQRTRSSQRMRSSQMVPEVEQKNQAADKLIVLSNYLRENQIAIPTGRKVEREEDEEEAASLEEFERLERRKLFCTHSFVASFSLL